MREVGSCTESGHEDLEDESLGGGSQKKVLGPWGRNLSWDGSLVGK